jgi:hypothetical protein
MHLTMSKSPQKLIANGLSFLAKERSELADMADQVHEMQRQQALRGEGANEGVRHLQAGSVAIKYGRSGAPKPTTFTLSADERTLSWQRQGVKDALKSTEGRSLALWRVQRMAIGRDSLVFEKFAQKTGFKAGQLRGQEHLSISLALSSEAATRSSHGETEKHDTSRARRSSGSSSGRDTLDVSFEDEEAFGLWVAALRALLPPTALIVGGAGARLSGDAVA